MTLSALCKENNHHTHLLAIRKHRIMDKLTEFQPNIIAYSTMSSEVDLFVKTDEIIKKWAQKAKRKITRIMGGPHPTYFPEILNQMQLDAICLGEGENALLHIINKIENNKKIENIPNVLTPGEEIESMEKELIPDLDKTPFLDRDIYYEDME